MNELKTQANPIRLREAQDARRAVVVHPEDDDLFVLTGRQVIQACRLAINVELWLHELDAALETTRTWCRERADRVTPCTVTARGPNTLLYFTPADHRFDFDLADEMAESNTDFIRNYNIGRIELFQIPMAELDRFADPSDSRTVYPIGAEASGKVDGPR